MMIEVDEDRVETMPLVLDTKTGLLIAKERFYTGDMETIMACVASHRRGGKQVRHVPLKYFSFFPFRL